MDLYPAHRARAVPQAARRRRASSASTRSTATSATRASRRSTTPSSRCSSSTRPTRDYRDLMDLTERCSPGSPRGVAGGHERRRGASIASTGRRRSGASRCARRCSMRRATIRGARAAEELDVGRCRSLAAARRFGVERPEPARGTQGQAPRPSSSRRWPRPGSSQPTFLHEFPTEISPLVASRTRTTRVGADRFELYAGGMEIANGFSELNDPAEQASRFRRQTEDRAAATTRRRPSTRTTSRRSSTACRPRRAREWGSTG